MLGLSQHLGDLVESTVVFTKEQLPSQSIMCTDIIFTVLNIALNKIEPSVTALCSEVQSIANDIGKRKEAERMEVVERTFNAKQGTIDQL